MAHPDVSIEASKPIVPAVTIDLRTYVSEHPWILAICAWTTLILAAAVTLFLAGDELLARSRQVAEWWWHRPEALVMGIVALLMALSALLAERDGRADTDKPLYDIR